MLDPITPGDEGVVSALNGAGFAVISVSDLFNRKLNYKAAVPILLHWLPRTTDLSTIEEIVRALSVEWAKPTAARALVELFPVVEDRSGLGLRWTIGNALAVVADDSVLEEISRFLRTREFGRSREMLAIALGNMHSLRADEILPSLLDDPELVGHALIAIRKRRVRTASSRVNRLLEQPRTWIRREAIKTARVLRE